MKTKVILLSVLMTVNSLAMAQVKSKKTTTKKNPKKAVVVKKKAPVSKPENIAAATQPQDSYSTGLWTYTKKFIEDNNSYFDENTGEYSTDNMDEYEISLFINGRKITTGNLYIEYLGDDAYQKYKMSFGGYSSRYSNSEDQDDEMENIIRKYLQGQFSATRFNF